MKKIKKGKIHIEGYWRTTDKKGRHYINSHQRAPRKIRWTEKIKYLKCIKCGKEKDETKIPLSDKSNFVCLECKKLYKGENFFTINKKR
ncbi:hypothetical protein ES703_120369 [subsurface metagenome]